MGIGTRKPWGLVALLALLTSLPEAARAVAVCLPDLPGLLAEEIVIPLGCELVDCCPGCPAGGSLDARVELSGDAVASAVLRLRGGGQRERSVEIGRGEVRLDGVAAAHAEGRPRQVSISLQLDREVLERWRSASKTLPPESELGTIALSVEQRLGASLVNELTMEWRALACFLPQPCDRVVLAGNTDAGRSVILLDGRREAGNAGCSDDEPWRATTAASLGNVLARDGCRSEIAVLSTGNALALRENVEDWRDTCGDTVTVDLEPILVAPLQVWVAVSALDSMLWWDEPDPTVVVKEDLDHAAQIYDQNKTGISFDTELVKVSVQDWKDILEVLKDTPVLDLLLQAVADEDPAVLVCALPAKLEELGFYRKDRINVYYLPLPFTGMICDDDRNVIFVGLLEKPATLAHELGHSFSLLGPGGHTRDVPGFDASNVMWVKDSTPRYHFSLGQAFRQNVDGTSSLNANHVREGTERPCKPLETSSACPALKTDWTRP